MSYVLAAPDVLGSAASDLPDIGAALTEAHTGAAIPTTSVGAPAADEVSAVIASLFSGDGQTVSISDCAGGGVSYRPLAPRYETGYAVSLIAAASCSGMALTSSGTSPEKGVPKTVTSVGGPGPRGGGG